MQNKNECLEIARHIFLSRCHDYLEIWLEAATRDEIKGLRVIHAIRKHQGHKKFRPLNRDSSSQFPITEEDFRKKTMQTFYKAEFSGESPLERVYHCDLLKYKKLNELKYSEILTNDTKIFLERWIALRDSEKYQQLMMTCLQAVYSVVKANNNIPLSTAQEEFKVIGRPRTRKINHSLNKIAVASRTPTIQPKIRPESRIKERSLNPIPHKIFYDPAYYKDRMTKIMRGSNNILKWVSDKNISSYQDNYFSKTICQKQSPNPLLSSTVIKLLPGKSNKN